MFQQSRNSSEETMHNYMVFFSNEWAIPPAFYWIAEVRGKSAQDAYKSNLNYIIQMAREFDQDILGDMSDADIEEGLCLVSRDSWMSLYNVEWRTVLAESE